MASAVLLFQDLDLTCSSFLVAEPTACCSRPSRARPTAGVVRHQGLEPRTR